MILRPILLLVLLNLFIPLCSAQTISIVSSQWPPYVDDSIPEKGLAVELVNKALQRKGYQPTLHIYNWQRALEGVEIGVFDATCAIWKTAAGAPCYLTKFRDSCRLNSFTYAANGRCPERPASVTTTHKSRFVITPSNGWTAIRNVILASLARYRALRLSELPCRLSGTKNHHFAIAPFP